jgi:hypothetical protein
MFVFISWSGEQSSKVASALNDWLPLIFQSVKPWISRYDIPVGSRWHTELSRALDATEFGIICLTRDNIDSPWVLFESGALSKSLAHGRIVPYLFDIDFSEVKGPLSYFQGIKADKNGTLRLIKEIAQINKDSFRNEKTLETVFEKFWPDLEKNLLPQSKVSPSVTFKKKSTKTSNEPVKIIGSKRNKIVFIDDRPHSISDEIQYCKKAGLEVEVTQTPNRLLSILNNSRETIILIVADIILPNVHDLSSVGIFEVQTHHGLNAGWSIIEHLLRSEDNRYKFADIPILILSGRPQSEMDRKRIKQILSKGGGWIEYLEKDGLDIDGKITWFEKFRVIIHKAMNQV